MGLTMRNIWQNTAISLGLKAVSLVMTVIPVPGYWPAILAETGVTVLVTANAMRLLAWREPDSNGGNGMREKPRNMMFLHAWLANPRRVGAVAPSGPELAKLITCEIDATTGPVLELGPGTGVFTLALVKRGVRQEDITMVELNDGFANLLAQRFPEAQLLRSNATRLARARTSLPRFGAVISGLPLLSMPAPAVFRIVAGAMLTLRPGSHIYQFTYGWRCPVPARVLEKLGLKAERVGTVISNIPPASVYRIGALTASTSQCRSILPVRSNT